MIGPAAAAAVADNASPIKSRANPPRHDQGVVKDFPDGGCGFKMHWQGRARFEGRRIMQRADLDQNRSPLKGPQQISRRITF
jgi:hypothetical protein